MRKLIVSLVFLCLMSKSLGELVFSDPAALEELRLTLLGMKENVPANTILGNFSCYDTVLDRSVVSLSTSTSNVVYLQNTGQGILWSFVRLTKTFDYDNNQNDVNDFNVAFSCSNGQTSLSVSYPVKIDDVNDNPPEFARGGNIDQFYSLDIPEILPRHGIQFKVPDMNISDADGPNNNKFTVNCTNLVRNPQTAANLTCSDYFQLTAYKITASDRFAFVNITAVRDDYSDGFSNSLEGNQVLYTLDVVAINVPAVDTEPTLLSEVHNLQITILDIQNTAPIFSQNLYGFTVTENSPVGQTIGLIQAYDGDQGNPNSLEFELLPSTRYPNGDQFFRLGNVIPPANLPRGYYGVELLVDRLIDRELDVTTPGKNIFVDILAYEIRNQTRIPSNSTVPVTVTVLDVNDGLSAFSSDLYSFALNELEGDITPGSTVLISLDGPITVVDLDGADFNSYTVSILPGLNSDLFTINPLAGSGTTIFTLSINNSALDYEAYTTLPARLETRLRAVDDSNPSLIDEAQVRVGVINVNEYDPRFTLEIYEFDVPEDATNGTFVGQVLATDQDSGSFGQIGSYRIVDSSNKFRIDQQGRIFLNGLLDFEDIPFYSFNVFARDEGGREGSALVNVEVTNVFDTPPSIIGQYIARVPEDSLVLQPDITVQATSEEQSSSIVFSLNQVVPATINVNEYFRINPVTGEFELIKLLDFGITNNGLIRVEVVASLSNNPNLRDTKFINITVDNLNNFPPVFDPIPVNGRYRVNISEALPENSPVFDLNTTDADEPNTDASLVEYTIISGANDRFRIGRDSGILTVSGVSRLDVDVQALYEINVRARDRGNPSKSANVIVEVLLLDANNKNPTFERALYLFNVQSFAPIQTLIGQVNATDLDTNSSIEYNLNFDAPNLLLLNNRPSSSPINVRNLIMIESTTGIIKVAGNITRQGYDRIQINATATDLNGQTTQRTTASVVISVVGQADPTILFLDPRWTPSNPIIDRNYPESDSLDTVGRSIIGLSAIDPTTSNRIENFNKIQDDGDYFDIRGRFGQANVLLKKPLNFEALTPNNNNRRIVSFVVEAISDTGDRTSTATVNIQVNDVNDNPPIFPRSRYEAEVFENADKGTTVIRISVTDADSGTYGISRFVLNSEKDDFTLVPSTVVNEAVIGVSENATIDRESLDEYTLTLFAIDNDGEEPNLQASTQIYVKVRDVNDNAPVFGQQVYEFPLVGTTEPPFRIGEVRATDPDEGPGGEIMYQLLDDDRYFIVEPEAIPTTQAGVVTEIGVIKLNKKVDAFPDGYKFNLTLVASDKDQSPRVGYATLIITVNRGERDPQPRWDEGLPTTVAIFENATIGTSVLKVTARPANISSSIIYSFVTAGDAERNSDRFSIDPVTGLITTNSTFKYDNRIPSNNFKSGDGILASYDLLLLATDASNSSFTRQFLLTVQILDIDDNVPTFRNCTDKTYPTVVRVSVMEEKDPGEFVYTVIGCDDDETPNNIIGYQPYYAPVNSPYIDLCPNQVLLFNDVFEINPQTGVITTRVPLDREREDTYLLCVQAVIPSNLRQKRDVWSVERNKRGIARSDQALAMSLHDVLLIRVNVLDANDNGPLFVETVVRKVILPYTSGGISRAKATDRDLSPNNQIRYSIDSIRFFKLPTSKPVDHKAAFDINGRTGEITKSYPNYQDFVGGVFNMTVVASDERGENNLTDMQEQLIYVTDNRNLIRVVIDKPADLDLKADIEAMIVELNAIEPGVYYQEMKTSYHIINNEKDPVFERTDVCFVIVRDKSVVNREDALDFLDAERQAMVIFDSYGAVEPGSCDPAKSVYPQGWESYWWVLVAFAIFIFICVLILIFIILSLYSGYKRYMNTRRTYLVPN